MKQKSPWPTLIGVVTIALLLSACSPSATTTAPTSSGTTPPSANPETTGAAPRRPEYGGTLSIVSDAGVFDPVATGMLMGPIGFLVNEQYVAEDWTKGAAGTGEVEWVPNTGPTPDTCAGMLAEAWEMPAIGTIIFKVRRGVHWALNPNSEASRLMNGREVTPDDWTANFNYLLHHPRSMIKTYAPQLASTVTMEKTGPWEITLKTPADPLAGWSWFAWGTAMYFLLPPEVINKYGDMRDWRNVVGTGPFMLTDYVAGSSATLARNPGFWEIDPAGPGKGTQLPYLDRIKMLAITDISTKDAALRTARVDMVSNLMPEEAKAILRSAPTLKHRTYLPLAPVAIVMRIDKAELPYRDKRVRQALMMATDFNALKNDLLGGDADILAYPVTKEAKRAYVPLEQMSESAQALYRYNPDKSKQLLAEAGYPEGFKAKMIVLSGVGVEDLASVYKAMWAKVGVDVELQPREMGVYSSIGYSRAYEHMYLAFLTGATQYPACLDLALLKGPASVFNVNDPVIETARQEIQKHVIIDMAGADRLYQELVPYILEQAYSIPRPSPYQYTLWWPWLKNYYGEFPGRFAAYCWIDQDLKQGVTGRR
jgi:peptide/nickel transport system substrate-binding protein